MRNSNGLELHITLKPRNSSPPPLGSSLTKSWRRSRQHNESNNYPTGTILPPKDQIRPQNILTWTFNPNQQFDKTLRRFTTNQHFWFHRFNHGWCKGIIQSTSTPMIYVRFGNCMYPTHETGFQPYFDAIDTPSFLRSTHKKTTKSRCLPMMHTYLPNWCPYHNTYAPQHF